MAIYPAYPNSEIYILKNIPITNEDKVNFYGKSAEFQAGYFLGAEYKTPDKFLRNKEKLDSIDISAMLKYYPNCVYVGLKYSVIKSNYIEIPINIYNLQSGNYLVFRNNIKPYVTDVEPDSESVDISHSENVFNDMYRSGETKPPILDWASTDFIYAFITNLEYINANVTRVYFAVDKFTTYCRDIQYKECLIEREHDDENHQFYYDFVNEDFQYESDEHTYKIADYSMSEIVLIVCEGNVNKKYFPRDTSSIGAATEYSEKTQCIIFGIPSSYGIYPIYKKDIKTFLTHISEVGNADLIKAVIPLPFGSNRYMNGNVEISDLALANQTDRKLDYVTEEHFIVRKLVSLGTSKAELPYKNLTEITANTFEYSVTFDLPTGNKPIRNNKTLSYINIGIYGNDTITYKTHWLKSNKITFVMKPIQLIPSLNLAIYIKDGDGINDLSLITNYTTSIDLMQYQFSYDTFIQNLANETVNINTKKYIQSSNYIKSILTSAIILGSVAAVPMSAGASLGLGLSAVGTMTAGSFNYANDEEKIKNSIAQTGADKSITTSSLPWNTKYVLGCLGFYLTVSYPNHTYITMIDDYFSEYGYKTNRIGKPRFITKALGNRKLYNYIKTTNCNYILNRPFEDINEIRQLFNNGVRMWTPYDYTDFAQGKICFGDKVTVNTPNHNA